MLFRSIRGRVIRRAVALGVLTGLVFAGIGTTSPAHASYAIPATNTCPVAGNVNITDSWHAPRQGHLHQGNDILAPIGRELLAVENGTLVSYDETESEGGTAGQNAWVHGSASNVNYFYAHLSAYVPALNEGDTVTKGQVIGYVGDTGNARGGASHLHFSISTDGTTLEGDGHSENPYPYLKYYWGCGGAAASEVGNVTLVPNKNGILELFYRGTDREPWATYQTSTSTWSSGHSNLSGTLMGNVVAGRNLDGRLQVFYRGGDSQLWTKVQDAANDYDGWTGEHVPLGGQIQLASEPAVIMNADGRLQAFYRGTDGQIWTTWQTTANGYTSWASGHLALGGTGTGSPVVARNANGTLVLLYVTSGGTIAVRAQSAASAVSSWTSTANIGGSVPTGMSVGYNSNGTLEIVYRGTDTQLWHVWQSTANGTFNSGHATLGGQVVGTPSVARNSDGRLEVAYRGMDNKIWHVWQTAPSSGWSTHAALNGTLANSPVISVNGDGRLQIAYRGSDNQPWTVWQGTPGGGWVAGHLPLGGTIG